jgi:hypothetical protein
MRYHHRRLALIIMAVAWFVTADENMASHIVSERSYWQCLPIGVPRFLLLGVCLMVGTMLIASSFPSEVHSPAGQKFIRPVAVACALFAVSSTRNSFIHEVAVHTNWACTAVHALHCLAIIAIWCAFALFAMLGHGSWRVIRCTLGLDGISFAVCAFALHGFGPPAA